MIHKRVNEIVNWDSEDWNRCDFEFDDSNEEDWEIDLQTS